VYAVTHFETRQSERDFDRQLVVSLDVWAEVLERPNNGHEILALMQFRLAAQHAKAGQVPPSKSLVAREVGRPAHMADCAGRHGN
jgi:hypothetical protein